MKKNILIALLATIVMTSSSCTNSAEVQAGGKNVLDSPFDESAVQEAVILFELGERNATGKDVLDDGRTVFVCFGLHRHAKGNDPTEEFLKRFCSPEGKPKFRFHHDVLKGSQFSKENGKLMTLYSVDRLGPSRARIDVDYSIGGSGWGGTYTLENHNGIWVVTAVDARWMS